MQKKYKQYLIHASLFIVTFFTTTLAGSFWVNSRIWLFTPYDWGDFVAGMEYSIPFLLILIVHEFGHYFTAKYHKVKTTLPYYIPLPPFPFLIGTMGAVIKIKEFVKSQKQNFDIGLSGPLAGFIMAMGFLVYGFTHLPEKDHIFEIHPEYMAFGDKYEEIVYTKDTFALKSDIEKLTDQDMSIYPDTIRFNSPEQQGLGMMLGSNLTFMAFEKILADPERMPNAHEMMHYPFLFAGFLALLFTALNLLPLGQLDGGHVLYGLIGSKMHRLVAQIVFVGFVLYAGTGIITPYDQGEVLFGMNIYVSMIIYGGFLYILFKGLKLNTTTTWLLALAVFSIQFLITLLYPEMEGYSGWLFFAFIVSRFIGVYHPITPIEEPLDMKRKILGWVALVIFIISFSPAPIVIP